MLFSLSFFYLLRTLVLWDFSVIHAINNARTFTFHIILTVLRIVVLRRKFGQSWFVSAAGRIVGGKLIGACKILSNLDWVDVEKMLPLVGGARTSYLCLKIRHRPFNTEMSWHFSFRKLWVFGALFPKDSGSRVLT